MPPLRNTRHEKFCLLLVDGKPASHAYPEAGYKEHRHNAATLARSKHIQARVAEILAEKQAKHEESQRIAAQELAIDKAWLMRKLSKAIDMAEAKQDASGITNAIKELGVLSGERIEKSEHGRPGEFAAIEAMSRAELEASIVKLVRQIEHEPPKLLEPPSDD